MEDLAKSTSPQGISSEWTELAFQEKLVGNTGVYILALSVLFVFLVLAAQYESWAMPMAILLIVPMAVLSNKPDRPTCRLVASLLPGHFQAVAGARVDVPKKPDPTAALAMAAHLGVAPADCGFVGDTAVDMRTATSAGMVPVGVTWGFRPRDELLAHGARWLIDHPAELLPLVTR